MKSARVPVFTVPDIAGLPASCRPLQMVHGLDQWPSTTDAGLRRRIRELKAAGLGGIVVSVSTKDYLCDPAAWAVLRRGVRLAQQAGLRVWIYDEAGYPSGAAGGRVFDRAPDVEAQGLVRHAQPGRRVRYQVTRLYEGTHATENFYEKRPYINLLEPRAVQEFIAVTHRRYAQVLRPIARYVEAFFTDEPSLIATYIPKGRDYPLTLPWHRDLPAAFKARTGYALRPHLESLFVDTGPADRRVRCDFYRVIAELCGSIYFGAIRRWCRRHQVASSGHLLGEESLFWQTMFNGEPFACYRHLDIPGIDMITSDPVKIMAKDYFMVPKVAGSACRLQGRRWLMCEISDFFGIMAKRHASLAQMHATAGIMFSGGVTDLCSYYSLAFKPKAELKPAEFPPETYRRYTDYVTRLKAWFAAGTIEARVAVLHPATSYHAHFTPPTRSMYEPHANKLLNAMDRGFTDLCRDLWQQRIGYDVIDETSLETARLDGQTLVIGPRRYKAIVLPPMDTIRRRTMAVLERFGAAGGSVFAHPLKPRHAAEGLKADATIRAGMQRLHTLGALRSAARKSLIRHLKSKVAPDCLLSPSSRAILCTRLRLASGTAYFLVNTSAKPFIGQATFHETGTATRCDPADGRLRPLPTKPVRLGGVSIQLRLPPFAGGFVAFRDQAPVIN